MEQNRQAPVLLHHGVCMLSQPMDYLALGVHVSDSCDDELIPAVFALHVVWRWKPLMSQTKYDTLSDSWEVHGVHQFAGWLVLKYKIKIKIINYMYIYTDSTNTSSFIFVSLLNLWQHSILATAFCVDPVSWDAYHIDFRRLRTKLSISCRTVASETHGRLISYQDTQWARSAWITVNNFVDWPRSGSVMHNSRYVEPQDGAVSVLSLHS
jgi:hypothetical protein